MTDNSVTANTPANTATPPVPATTTAAPAVPATTTATTTAAVPDNVDLSSILTKLATLEKENRTMKSKFGKLQTEKIKEMNEMMNGVIQNWISHLSAADEASKEQLKAGLQSLVNEGNESGVWQVVACASANFQNSVLEIERLTNEVNSLRQMKEQFEQGRLADEESRISGSKRSVEEISEDEVRDVWSELQNIMQKENTDRVY